MSEEKITPVGKARLAKLAAEGQQRKAEETKSDADSEAARRMQSSADKLLDEALDD